MLSGARWVGGCMGDKTGGRERERKEKKREVKRERSMREERGDMRGGPIITSILNSRFKHYLIILTKSITLKTNLSHESKL